MASFEEALINMYRMYPVLYDMTLKDYKNKKMELKYRLNTENGGFTADKSPGPKAPRDLSGVKPMFEVEYIYLDPIHTYTFS